MKNSKVINKSYNKSFILAKILRKAPFISSSVNKKFNTIRHKEIIRKLTPIFDYAYYSLNTTNNATIEKSSDNIWIFWWQGESEMPQLVKKCYESIKKNKGKRNVVLITQYNVQRYATLPDCIYKRVQNNEISLTHFSDALRFNLLNNYGGLWMDSTLYVTDSLDKFSTNHLFTCSGYEDNNFFNISKGNWTSFFIGGPAKIQLFQFMNNFFEEYWKYNDIIIDYFLMDYALNYAYKKNISEFQKISKQYKDVAPHLLDMQSILNKTYNKDFWDFLIGDTSVFKLSYKHELKKDLTTYYYKTVDKGN